MTTSLDSHAARFSRREFCAASMSCAASLLLQHVVRDVTEAAEGARRTKWRVGHHFWNWDHAWNTAELLDQRLRLTRETGYEGFEAKPQEMGVPGEIVKQRSENYGVCCAAVGAGGEEGVDYARAAGASILRTKVSKSDAQQLVEYADERGVILVVHPHLAKPGTEDAVETREDLLRYLDERPGVFACPDTGHLALCGSDPVRTIRDLGRRCRYIHLKDIRPERVGRKYDKGEKFCELGTGALDLAGVIKALEDIHYEGWIMVERDSRVSDYVQSARNMRNVLRRMGI